MTLKKTFVAYLTVPSPHLSGETDKKNTKTLDISNNEPLVLKMCVLVSYKVPVYKLKCLRNVSCSNSIQFRHTYVQNNT
jgi:hypothetical protein